MIRSEIIQTHRLLFLYMLHKCYANNQGCTTARGTCTVTCISYDIDILQCTKVNGDAEVC